MCLLQLGVGPQRIVVAQSFEGVARGLAVYITPSCVVLVDHRDGMVMLRLGARSLHWKLRGLFVSQFLFLSVGHERICAAQRVVG